jgi:hypothetical protein
MADSRLCNHRSGNTPWRPAHPACPLPPAINGIDPARQNHGMGELDLPVTSAPNRGDDAPYKDQATAAARRLSRAR